MKNKFLIIISLMTIFTNCSLNDTNDNDPIIIKTLWNLTNVSGGIAGVNNDFDLGTIIWTFSADNSTLTVINNNTDDTIEDGLDSGTYPYTIETIGDNSFLTLADNEYGKLTVSETELVIDQNITSTGTGADGFIFTFKRITLVE